MPDHNPLDRITAGLRDELQSDYRRTVARLRGESIAYDANRLMHAQPVADFTTTWVDFDPMPEDPAPESLRFVGTANVTHDDMPQNYYPQHYVENVVQAAANAQPTIQYLGPAEYPHTEPPEYRVCNNCGVEREARRHFGRRANGEWFSSCRACRHERRNTTQRMTRYGRRFGVEIEFDLVNQYGDPEDSDVIADALRERGINVWNEGYTHEVMPEWKIVNDASVDNGWELVSPPLHWHQRDEVVRVCEVLSGLGADASDQCGLHVHHEVSDLTLIAFKRLVAKWAQAQEATDRLVLSDRRDGEWCRHLRPREVEGILACSTLGELRYRGYDRYRTLNLECFSRYGTVEMRQHQGTIDPDEILSWVEYGQAFIESCKSRRAIPHGDVDQLLDRLPFKEETARAVMKRKIDRRPNRDPRWHVDRYGERYRVDRYGGRVYADEE